MGNKANKEVEVIKYYKIGGCYKTLKDLRFFYITLPSRSYWLLKGTIITYIESFYENNFLHAVFLVNGVKLVGPGGLSESVETIKERLTEIVMD